MDPPSPPATLHLPDMLSGCNVLVVDDEDGIRNALRRALLLAGVPKERVRMAANAEAAVQELQREPADLVVTDYRMTGKTGADLLGWLKERHPTTGRVLMTGYLETPIAIEAITVGHADGYVKKPWELDELLRVLRRVAVLRRREAMWERAKANALRLMAARAERDP